MMNKYVYEGTLTDERHINFAEALGDNKNFPLEVSFNIENENLSINQTDTRTFTVFKADEIYYACPHDKRIKTAGGDDLYQAHPILENGRVDHEKVYFLKYSENKQHVALLSQDAYPLAVIDLLLQHNLLSNEQNVPTFIQLKELHKSVNDNASSALINKILNDPKLLEAIFAMSALKAALATPNATAPNDSNLAETKAFIDIAKTLTVDQVSTLTKFLNDPNLQNNQTYKTTFNIKFIDPAKGDSSRQNQSEGYKALFVLNLAQVNSLTYTGTDPTSGSTFDQLTNRISEISSRTDPDNAGISDRKAAALKEIKEKFQEAKEGKASLQDCLDLITAKKSIVSEHSYGKDSVAAKFYMWRHGHESTSAQLLTKLEQEVRTLMAQPAVPPDHAAPTPGV